MVYQSQCFAVIHNSKQLLERLLLLINPHLLKAGFLSHVSSIDVYCLTMTVYTCCTASGTSTKTEYLEALCATLTILPAKSDSDDMFCLQNYKGLIIDRSFVY